MPTVQLVLLSVVILTSLQTGVARDNDDIASMISAVVREILLPIMKEIKNDLNSINDDLNSVKNDLSSLNKTVSNLSDDLEDYKQQTASELAGLTSELAGLQSSVTSELAGLQSSVTSELAGLQSNVTSELAGLQSNVTSTVISTCTGFLPRDCCQIKVAHSFAVTGLYEIIDPSDDDGKIHVRCDMETDGGGWIVIQRRIANGTVNFYRNWEDYVNGFGDLDGEFWIGLNNTYQLTNQQEVELQISVWNEIESSITWNYQTFRISGPENKYRLTVGGGTGDGSDALAYHNGQYFSTYDRDNDGRSGNCAYVAQGGWWYNNCYHANLNGRHQRSGLHGVWETGQLLRYYDGTLWSIYTNSVMMIRSKTCGLG